MTELCHLGKRTILPHLKCIPVPLPKVFNHWAYTVGPTEFSHAGGIAEHWDFWSVFQAGFVWELDGRGLSCVTTLRGNHSYLHCKFSPHYPRKGEKCLPSNMFAGNIPKRRLFGLPKSQ